MNKELNLDKVKNFSNQLKKNIIDVAYLGGGERSHIGGALSASDIVSVLDLFYQKDMHV